MVSTGNTFSEATKTLALQTTKAMYALESAMKNVGGLPFSAYFKIFDSVIAPVLLYGSEIWGIQRYDVIENVHIKACKKFLGVSYNTSNNAALGECGRPSMYTFQIMHCIKFWLKLISMPNDRYPKKCYTMLFNLDQRGLSNWTTRIKHLLQNAGFGVVWQTQGVGDVKLFLDIFATRIRDISFQTWYSDMRSRSKLRTYIQFKTILAPERYLLNIQHFGKRRAMAKLRCSDHPLRVETGRWYITSMLMKGCVNCVTMVMLKTNIILFWYAPSLKISGTSTFLWCTGPTPLLISLLL